MKLKERSKMKRLIAIVLGIALISPTPANANQLAVIETNNFVIGSTTNTSNIWQGNIPTSIGVGKYDRYKVEFSIQGLLPYETLAAKNSRGTGVNVEFEIWSDSGKKVAYDTVSSYSWNPVGPNTLVDFYLFDMPIGTHTLIIRTQYELSTTGLLTRYVEGKITQKITIYDIDLRQKQQAEAKAAAELKAKQEAEAKAIAEAKAKVEAELKAKQEAELKAKQEAEAKAEAELKAKQEAEAKAAELKAKQEAEAKAKAEAKTWTCRKDLQDYYFNNYNMTIALMNEAESDIFCNKLWEEINAKAKAEARASAEALLKPFVGKSCKTLGDYKVIGVGSLQCIKVKNKKVWGKLKLN